jgi:hypothetical protein
VRWNVFRDPPIGPRVPVEADRVHYDNGTLKFFNDAPPGKRWGDTVAIFTLGQWLYVNKEPS